MRISFILIALLFIQEVKGQHTTASFLKITITDSLDLPKAASLEISYYGNNVTEQLPLTIGRTITLKKELEEPVLAHLKLSWEGKKAMNLRFFLPVDTGELLIEGKNKVKFAYKNQQKLVEDFIAYEKQISSLKNTAATKIKGINFENRQIVAVQSEIDSIAKHYDNLIDHHIYRRVINEQKDSFLAVLALMEYAEHPFEHQRKKFATDSILMMYDSFNEQMKSLPSMQALYKSLLTAQALNDGNLFPSLKLMDKNNTSIELSKLYGKYTLIDFWANWCMPCRAENPNLINQYQKYKDKGLTILSISIDKLTDKYLWMEAIKKDGIGLWPNFIDTDQMAKQQLNIRFIPTNFLIDSNGKIIAKDLMDASLNRKLKELFEK